MRKKLALLMASLFLIVGTAWAQTPVLKLMSGQIGNSYPLALSDADAEKVFALEDLTVAVKVNAASFTNNDRMALFCTSDPTQNANTDVLGTGSHYVAYGFSGNKQAQGAVGYLASCVKGDRFTSTSGVVANSQEVVLVYVINPSNNTYTMYINGVVNGSWVKAHNDGFMSGYEIATPKMVKSYYSDAKIYIGGGVKADNSSFETFNGTITGVEVYNGALTAEQVKNVFPPVAGKVYQLKNRHDSYHLYDAADANNLIKGVAPAEVDINNKNQLWVLGKSATAGKYTLRNAGTKRYMKPGSDWTTSKALTDLYIVDNSTANGLYYFNISSAADAAGHTNLHCWSNTANAINYAANGGGSQFTFVLTDVTVADLAALAITNELNPLINEANTLKSNIALTGTAELTALTTALTTANGLTSSQDWDAVLASVDALTVAIQNANAYIEANPSGPEATDLYALKSPSGTYFNFTAVVPEPGAATTYASFQDEPSFVYKKSDVNGVYFQSLEDESKFIGYQTTGNYWITTTQKSYWTISEESGWVEFTRKQTVNGAEQTVRLGHDKNTNAGTGIFTNVGASCNKWQLIPAYPITIVYKNGEEVIRTVKAAAMSGESYAFDIDLNGGTLVSCTADKGTATVEDNRCTIAAVNGATTVTVTLNLPTVPFAPEVGKAYVLKVVGTDKYLDIRTLGNDDPNASGSNNISTSTKPYPIYFEQGQNGTWKMKNANGKYVGLYPGKDWDPVIGASSHDWTMDGSANNFTIARGSGKYINYNTDADKVVGKPLYCDKGTGLHFRLVDYNDVDFITGAGLGKEGADSPYVSIKEIDAEGTTTSIPTGMGWVLTIEVENPNGASHGKYGSSILATGKAPFPYKDRHNGFQLYLQSGTNGAKKLDVVFGNADHIVDNVSYIGDFSAVITYDGISKLQVKTTNANGGEETNNYEVTLPEISEFAYGLPTGINIKRLAIETIDREYTFAIGETPNDQEVAVTYNGETLAEGDIIVESKLNLDLFGATEIEGYTWNVIADKETSTLTLNYTEAEVLDLQAVKDLVNRIGGAGTADKFKFVHTPWLNSKQETFVLGSEEGKILIKGTTISAITTGLGWYLNHVAKINIAWNSLNEKTVSGAAYADLSNLPLPATEETHTSDAKYRYYLNTCTFGYSMTSWTWKRWQQEIDWMALHGINMPLQLVGLEEVWRKFLINQGYSETDAKAFVAGPAFIAWWAMNNLQGWGGTAAGSKSGYNNLPGAGGVQDDAWYARQKKLAKQIVDAQRALGMQPVLPGWSGMVPTNFAEKSTGKYATRENGGKWAGDFVRPLLLNTSIGAEKYAEIAADYYACLKEVMGESQYYSMDPFHEGGGAGTMEDYKYMYAAMEAAKSGSQWVIQQWQWSATQKYSLTAVPAGKLIVLDLFSDGSPAFDGYNGYAPQDAVFCAIPNFGGRSGLMGRLQNVTDNYFKFKGKYASIKGIGTAPEAIEQTPVTYDLIYQLPWMNGQKPNVAEWVDNYAYARYGKNNSIVKEAWSLLRQGPLNYGADGIQGPVEDVWAARPNLDVNAASAWGSTLSKKHGGGAAPETVYNAERQQMLIDAVYKLIDQEDELALADGSVYKSNYLYDIVEFGGGVMADYAHDLLKGIKEAKNASNTALYEARRDAFLQLILDMDAFRGTNLNFRLGKWTQEARDAADEVEGATTATPDWYEYNNARTILTTWSSPGTNLNDYSYRSWQGLLKDYYYKRWKHYFDNNCTSGEYKFFEWNWAHGKEHYVGQTGFSNVDLTANQDGHTSKYTREPEGNTVEIAKSMLAKYIIPVKYNDGTTYYAYRTLTTDLTGKTFNVISGSTADFTTCFNLPDDVTATITGSLVNSPATDITNVTLPAEGTYTATLTLSDGTVLSNFTVKVNAPLNGYYYVKHNDQPVFVRNHRASSTAWPWYSAGDKMIGHASGVTPTETEKILLITPSQNGYTLSAQGKYMGVTALTTTEHREHWDHIIFSEDKATAGQYVLEGADSYRLRCVNGNDNDYAYVGSYGGDPEIFGNDVKANAVNFSFVPVTSYPITVPDEGFTTLYLPFNVVLPEGVEAYDINDLSNEKLMQGNVMVKIAEARQTLKAKTAVIIKAEPGRYQLQLTSNDANAKTSLDGSVLHGTLTDYVLSYNEEDPIKKFLINGDRYDAIRVRTTVHANTCWIEAEIDDTAIDLELKFIEIPAEEEGKSWKFKVRKSGKGIVITDCLIEQSGALVIGSTYEVDGEDKDVIGISDDFLYYNEDLTEITLPATLTDLGSSVLDFMFEQSYVGDQKEGTAHPLQNTVLGASTWVMTVDVDIAEGAGNFNQFGSCLLATKSATLADRYDDGSMQLYLQKDHATLIFKYDNADDRYKFKATDAQGQLFAADKIKLTLDNDGAGTATVKAVFYKVNEDGEITYTSEPQYRDISVSDGAELNDFATVWSSLPEGFNVNVKFEKKSNQGLFVGCTKLTAIHVEEGSKSFHGCEHGVLYNSTKQHVLRFPEGGGEVLDGVRHFEVPYTVTRVNPGALHDVEAHVTFHSNPAILHVENHEGNMKATYHLSLEDDSDAEDDKTYAVDFISANNNEYQSARYKRAPLETNKFGTICLPFVPTNALNKYDFFEFKHGDASSFVFSQVASVADLKVNTAYLYKLKDKPSTMTTEDGLDVFETDVPFTVDTHAKYNPDEEKAGTSRALGSYVNFYIETKNYKDKSAYYYFSTGSQKFLKVTEQLNYRPYRAIFVVNPKDGNTSQAPARISLRLLDGTTTDIDASLVEGMETPVYYDLSGRRVLNPGSGVYIVNGKKVFIK